LIGYLRRSDEEAKVKSRLLVIAATAAIACSCGEPAPSRPQQIEGSVPVRAAVTTFLASHPELGEPSLAFPAPDWAQGSRQRVRTTKGDYLVYLQDGEVVTVNEYVNGTNEMREVWRKP
jgi:hypothetical protein